MYSESVDIWACGVLLYLLLSCRLPFNADVEVLPSNRAQVARKFELSFPEAVWERRSESVKDLLRRMLVTDPLKRFSAHQVIRHPWTLYGAAADARGNKNNKAKKEGEREAGGGKPPAFQAKSKGGEFLENPQESSGHRSKARSSSGEGNSTPTSSNGAGLLRSTMAGQQHVQQPYCPKAAAGSNGIHTSSSPFSSSPSSASSSPSASMSMAAAMVINQDGNIRHVRSHLNLDRMRLPANTTYSRTPPIIKKPPLRPSTTLGGSNKLPLHNGGGGNSRSSRGQRVGGYQKPVLVSYFPQTLHNAVAGDLSSTSNLSLKFAMNNTKTPPMNHQRTTPGAMPPVGEGAGGLVEKGRERVVVGISGLGR